MIFIDGFYLEGGGQIIRTAIALSSITGKPIKINNIRAKRPNPGLRAQHLTGIKAAAEICDAKIKNAEIGSTEIEFTPNKIKGGHYKFDIGTAGSVTLLLQTLVPICLHANKETNLEIIGGTDVKWSPTIHYFKNIFLNGLEIFGMKRKEDFNLEIDRYGFYPKGNGKIKFKIKPFRKLKQLNLIKRGKLERIDAISIASEILKNRKVSERQIEGVEKILKINGKKEVLYPKTLSTGSSLHIQAHFENCKLGSSVLGELGKPAEKIGEECANLLKKQIDSRACLDEWMADQILPYMALTGNSKVSVAKITNHVKTNIFVIEQFLPVKFKINEEKNIISI